ncbi:MAG: polyprenyl diphosphate synthase [Myxococcota bacterium]
MSASPLPRHIAIIMDGNGRWAAARDLPRSEGHRAGAKAVRKVVTQARLRGIEVLTLYAFSAQNWNRPADEVDRLMALLVEFCEGERDLLMDEGIRFRTVGDRTRLPAETRQAVETLEEITFKNSNMQLLVALSYGGREEIVAAARSLAAQAAAGTLAPAAIDETAFAAHLTTAGVPDPDLLVRTSGEFRVSNFLLWQIAYAEIVIESKHWPDYAEADLDRAIDTFANRERRFGGLAPSPAS